MIARIRRLASALGEGCGAIPNSDPNFGRQSKIICRIGLSVIKKPMRYFFIDPSAIKDRVVTITGSEAHHIKTVLRLKPGDDLKLFDGTGYE